jgi:hypothetical protein
MAVLELFGIFLKKLAVNIRLNDVSQQFGHYYGNFMQDNQY